MKALTDYPTPETDAAWDSVKGSLYWENHPTRMNMESLERRLGACRKALEMVLRRGYSMQRSDQYLREVLEAARIALTLTSPLAELK